jgi:Family of unknown function (DUF5999)
VTTRQAVGAAAAALHTRTACSHRPPCPSADRADRLSAVVVAAHPEQGWYLLCNGIVTFDDTGAVVGDAAIPPCRALTSRRGRNRAALPNTCDQTREEKTSCKDSSACG